jgi:hypothetical protein
MAARFGARGAGKVPGYARPPPGPAVLLILIDALFSSRLTRTILT